MIYEKIKELCKEKNISVTELEEKLDFSRGYLGKWNAIVPSVLNVKKVADYFGVTIESLIEEN